MGPDGVETTDLKWFSVWCRRFSANFGDLFFPEGFALEGEKPVEATSKDLPPPAAIPGNALDHDHHHHDDDPESEPEPYGAASSISASVAVFVSALLTRAVLA